MSDKKRPQPDHRIVFLDLETTGLDPERDRILELGIVVVDAELEPLFRYSAVIGSDLHPEDLVPNNFVREMHEKSELLPSVLFFASSPQHQLAAVERNVLGSLRARGLPRGLTTMAGYSPHFDRSFLRVHAPALDRFFDHRMIDVSTLRGLERRWLDPDIDEVRKAAHGETKHRAIDDCVAAIEELRSHRHRFQKVPSDYERALVNEKTKETP